LVKKTLAIPIVILLISLTLSSIPLPAVAATDFTLWSNAQTETTITLNWDKSNDVWFYNYKVWMSTSGTNGPFTNIWTSDGDKSHNSLAVTALTPDTTYWFYVEDSGLAVGYRSNTYQVSTAKNPILTLVAQTTTTASLSWTDYNTYSTLVPFSSYTVQMSTTSVNGPWSTLTSTTDKTQTTYTVTGLSIGMYYIRMYDTIGGGSSSVNATSSYSNILAISHVSVGITPNTATTITLGQSVQFSASPAGGSGAYYYQWYSNDAAIIGANSASYTFTPQTWGTSNIKVTIQDAFYPSSQATSSTIQITAVPPSLTAAISSSAMTAQMGQQIQFTAVTTGGTGSYNYNWYINGVKADVNAASYTLTTSQVGNCAVYVIVTDLLYPSLASATSNTLTINVPNPTPSPSPTPTPSPSPSPTATATTTPTATQTPTPNDPITQSPTPTPVPIVTLSPAPTPSPTVPELTPIITAALLLLVAIFGVALSVTRKKQNKQQ
jgi:hypothetical protein